MSASRETLPQLNEPRRATALSRLVQLRQSCPRRGHEVRRGEVSIRGGSSRGRRRRVRAAERGAAARLALPHPQRQCRPAHLPRAGQPLRRRTRGAGGAPRSCPPRRREPRRPRPFPPRRRARAQGGASARRGFRRARRAGISAPAAADRRRPAAPCRARPTPPPPPPGPFGGCEPASGGGRRQTPRPLPFDNPWLSGYLRPFPILKSIHPAQSLSRRAGPPILVALLPRDRALGLGEVCRERVDTLAE